MLDSVKYSEEIRKIVTRNSERKYYRLIRPARFYGGIASSDCSGCNLRCVFCWSNDSARQGIIGKFYSPRQVFDALVTCAEKFNFKQLRITGNEPTISREHLLKILELVEETGYSFILETNGILIGHDKSYAIDLSRFNCLHIRVSIKGVNEKQFEMLTLADAGGFNLQLTALKNLMDEGVSCHPAVMLSFCRENEKAEFVRKLEEIDRSLVENLEEEYIFLYPHVVRRLKASQIKPVVAFSPDRIPKELI